MDGNRFDDLVRNVAHASGSRRRLLKSGFAAVFVALGVVERTDAAIKRGPGQICRKHGDCQSNNCLPKDSTGRRYCGCESAEDCPGASDCVTAICDQSHRCLTQNLPDDSICPTGYCLNGQCFDDTGSPCESDQECKSGNCAEDPIPPNSLVCCPAGVIHCGGTCCQGGAAVCYQDGCCESGWVALSSTICCPEGTTTACSSECCSGTQTCRTDSFSPENFPEPRCCNEILCNGVCCPTGTTTCDVNGNCSNENP